MKETGSPKILFKNLDLTPIHPTLWKDLHTDGPGRPVEYNPEWDLKVLMLRQLLQIPYMKDLVKRLKRNPNLRRACRYGEKAPTEAHFTQIKKRIGFEGFHIIEAWLRREALKLRNSQPLMALGLVQAACVDGRDLKARSSRSLDNKRASATRMPGWAEAGRASTWATDPSSSPTSRASRWATWRPQPTLTSRCWRSLCSTGFSVRTLGGAAGARSASG
jgi:hypothetical protein